MSHRRRPVPSKCSAARPYVQPRGSMTPLRTALYQGPAGVPASAGDSLAALGSAARRAAAAGARLLVAPEMYLTGYALGDQVAGAGRGRRRALRACRRRARRRAPPRDRLRLPRAGRRRRPQRRAAHRPGRRPARPLPQDPPVRPLRAGPLHSRRRPARPGRPGRRAPRAADLLRRGVPRGGARPRAGRHRPAGRADGADAARTRSSPNSVLPARAWESQLYIAYANRGRTRRASGTSPGSAAWPRPTAPSAPAPAPARTWCSPTPTPPCCAASRAANPYLTDRRPELYALTALTPHLTTPPAAAPACPPPTHAPA